MFIIPAIDLYQKKVVRLIRGDKNRCKVYSQDPLAVARNWFAAGAKWLHLVDLSAAFSQGNHCKTIAAIKKEVGIKIEVGGGIRSLAKIKQMLSFGADRLILGTAATDSNFLSQALEIAGSEKIIVAVDEKKGKIAVSGWEKSFALPVGQYLSYLKKKGVKRVIYTDISADGMLKGPSLGKAKKFSNQKIANFILAGGVTSLQDIKNIKNEVPFAEAIIIGKALYEQKINLSEAIRLTIDKN